jgi:hypothetical protein
MATSGTSTNGRDWRWIKGGQVMRISRRIVVLAMITVALTLSISAAGAAVASPSSDHEGSGRTFRLHTVLVSTAVNDAGHGGPGNVVALLFDLQTPGGKKAGQGFISCTNVTADVQLCHAAFVLADGQIEAQAAIPVAATTFPVAVMGGTGAYNGVTGQIDNVRSAPGVVDRTFHLIRSHN